MSGTQYQLVSLFNPPSAGCNQTGRPPARFWLFDDYGLANSGCFVANTDPGTGVFPVANSCDPLCGNPTPRLGTWFLVDGNWAGHPTLDGCHAGDIRRTVLEVSDVYPTNLLGPLTGEATVNHGSWYLITAIEYSGGGYDFDQIRGADSASPPPPPYPQVAACNPATPMAAPVPGLAILARGGDDCTGDPDPTPYPDNGNGYIEVDVCLAPAGQLPSTPTIILKPTPDYFTEVGRNDPSAPLIEGFEILYHAGNDRTNDEPTTSLMDIPGYWLPALDPVDPTRALPPVPYGAEAARVALPAVPGVYYWLATRLVYTDCSLNGSKLARPSCAISRPPLPSTLPVGSLVGPHCGPVGL